MRVTNPFYVDPVIAEADAMQAAIEAFMKSKPAKPTIGINRLTAAVPALATASRAAFNVVMQRLGADIDELGDSDA